MVTIKAIQLATSSGVESTTNQWDGSNVQTTRAAAKRAYAEAGITNPRAQINLMEVHDCFSITELVTMEDLFVSMDGRAVSDVLDGFFDRDGNGIPCQVDGGLKCFGHPVAASGLRMAYEIYNQLQSRAEKRQLKAPTLGLTHNLGGVPYLGVAAVSILGLYH
jgi:acetyl-CoA C-acetyltransferase